jgi:transposase
MADLEFVESRMTRIEAEICRRLQSSADTVERLCTVPGIDRVSAWGIISEIGLDMSQFPDAQHLASWAGLCPGNWESAGKQKSGRARKGSAWLRRHLCQLAWGVSTKQLSLLVVPSVGSSPRGQTSYHGCRSRTPGDCLPDSDKNGVEYHELGADYFDRLNPVRLTRRLVKRLEGLGFQVMLEARPA